MVLHAYVLRAWRRRGCVRVEVVPQAVTEVGAPWRGNGVVGRGKAGEERAGLRAGRTREPVIS